MKMPLLNYSRFGITITGGLSPRFIIMENQNQSNVRGYQNYEQGKIQGNR